jgi:hypothetical protein
MALEKTGSLSGAGVGAGRLGPSQAAVGVIFFGRQGRAGTFVSIKANNNIFSLHSKRKHYEKPQHVRQIQAQQDCRYAFYYYKQRE